MVSLRRHEHLAQLEEQLVLLHSNLQKFQALVKDTAVQAQSIQNLGVMHGALFVASHTVLGSKYNDSKER